jgi:hypothetical protein
VRRWTKELPVSLFVILLFLHVMGAIIAFGPGFAAMVVGPMVAKEPQHANFYARTQLAASMKLVTPASLSMAVTGILMILDLGWSNITAGAAGLICCAVVAGARSPCSAGEARRTMRRCRQRQPAQSGSSPRRAASGGCHAGLGSDAS